jgi:hypothetical protein
MYGFGRPSSQLLAPDIDFQHPVGKPRQRVLPERLIKSSKRAA